MVWGPVYGLWLALANLIKIPVVDLPDICLSYLEGPLSSICIIDSSGLEALLKLRCRTNKKRYHDPPYNLAYLSKHLSEIDEYCNGISAIRTLPSIKCA